jgi:hypothetical protein
LTFVFQLKFLYLQFETLSKAPSNPPLNTTILDPKVEAGLPIPKKKHDKDYLVIEGNFTFFNPLPISVNLTHSVGLDCSIYFEGEKIIDTHLPLLRLSGSQTNRLPFFVKTDPYTMELLNTLIEKVADGQKVNIQMRDFQWLGSNPRHDWIQRQFLDGLTLTLPIQITETDSSFVKTLNQIKKYNFI